MKIFFYPCPIPYELNFVFKNGTRKQIFLQVS
jgi:hypothetical protein